MPRIDGVNSIVWPNAEPAVEPVEHPPVRDAPRSDGARPVPVSGAIRTTFFDGPAFADLAAGAELKFAADPTALPRLGAQLLDAAKARLDADGVAYDVVTSFEGFDALAIRPERTGHKLAEPAADLADLDGFAFLYSPAKLLKDGTRGTNWRYRREVFLAHQAIDELRLDPITIHEIEHTVLSRCEEKGIPQLFTGWVSTTGASISDAASEVGGYKTYLSFQEISAYSIQCELLATRLEQRDPPPNFAAEVKELAAMSRWGAALCERVVDVARRSRVALDEHPEHAVFEQLRSMVAPKGGPERAAGPANVWADVRSDTIRVEVPLPHGAAAYERMAADPAEACAALRALARDHFDALAATCEKLAAAFAAVRDEATQLEGRVPLERHHVGRLVERTRTMRQITTTDALAYRYARE